MSLQRNSGPKLRRGGAGNFMSARPNAAIYYAPEAFDTSRTRLLGRHAAGEGFLDAFVRHGEVDRLYAYCRTREEFESFKSFVARAAESDRKTAWIPHGKLDQLAQPESLFVGGPGIADLAWQRRHLDPRTYSICGITHTTASHAVMDAIGTLPIAPVQPWDAIICTSSVVRKTVEHVLEGWQDYLATRLSAKSFVPLQLPVIPLGVDCKRFERSAAADKARKELRQRHGIADDDLVVLFLGRLSFHAKAHPLPMYLGLEHAAQRLKRRIHLVQVGWFANEYIENAFREGAKAYCPSVNAIFLDGRQPENRWNIWFAADLFTSLSDNIQETFGLVPIEALAAGLPMVVSDWDGYRDTVRHGIDGLMVPTAMSPPGTGMDLALRHVLDLDTYDRYIGHASQCVAVDVGACAEAYTSLLGNPELRKTMGEAGYRRAREIFDWPHIIAAYQELWRELGDRRKKAAVVAPLTAGRPPHPLRDDPFSVFRSYPSTALQDDTVIVPRFEGKPPDLAGFLEDPLTSGSKQLLATAEERDKLLAMLGTTVPCTVSDLLEPFPKGARRRFVLRTLVWLAKVGLVSIGKPDHRQP